MKVNILCEKNVVLHDAVIWPTEDDADILLSDVDVQMQNWGHCRTGLFRFPIGRSLEVSQRHYIGLENGDRIEITFTRVLATGDHLRVGFKLLDGVL